MNNLSDRLQRLSPSETLAMSQKSNELKAPTTSRKRPNRLSTRISHVILQYRDTLHCVMLLLPN